MASQASEGWRLVNARYDDGGLSGGTLERPALQRLLADIAAGEIDIVVVYKVDRLTRSLLDFAKLVETFDSAGASFVSVTQSFNTTTSMGRLTLNMLLSFAQFEREVTAERIRDKIAASKAKGMWMGGTPPLGYAPNGRSLAIVEDHAQIVRMIFERYLALGNVRRLASELAGKGIGAPVRQRLSGETYGGVAFTRGQLYAILKNPVYVGDIVHKGQRHAGLHAPIIAREMWDAVQAMLAGHAHGTRAGSALAHPAPLAGKIVDTAGEPLISVHAAKRVGGGGRAPGEDSGKLRYRYYVSRALHHGDAGEGTRLPAREIEGLVTARIADLFADPFALAERLRLEIDPARMTALTQACAELAAALKVSRRRDIASLIHQVRVHDHRVEIEVNASVLAEMLGASIHAPVPPTLLLTEDVRLTRTGRGCCHLWMAPALQGEN